jgi:OOP family OmpA-OmpF porin
MGAAARMNFPSRLLLAAFVLSFAPPARAYEERSRYAVGVQVGPVLPMSPSEFSSAYKGGTHIGGEVRQDLTQHWAVAAAFSNQNSHEKAVTDRKLATQPLLLMGYYSLVRTQTSNPYLAAGLGFSRNTQKVFSRDREWTKLSAAVGLGVEFNAGTMSTFGVEALYRYFTGASQSDKNFQLATVAATVHFYIPDTWIPDRPKRPLITAPPVEAPPPSPVVEDSIKQQAQQELNQVRQDIFEKKIPDILFEAGQAVLLSSSYETLDVVGTILRRYPQFTVRVEGHTDDVGDDATNVVLSQARAEAVRAYLMQNFTIPPEKIAAAGYGESLPIADNGTEEGRARNRRVEFKIVQ